MNKWSFDVMSCFIKYELTFNIVNRSFIKLALWHQWKYLFKSNTIGIFWNSDFVWFPACILVRKILMELNKFFVLGFCYQFKICRNKDRLFYTMYKNFGMTIDRSENNALEVGKTVSLYRRQQYRLIQVFVQCF